MKKLLSIALFMLVGTAACLDDIEPPEEISGACFTSSEDLDQDSINYDKPDEIEIDGSCEDDKTYKECVKGENQLFFLERKCSELAAIGGISIEGFDEDGNPLDDQNPGDDNEDNDNCSDVPPPPGC